MISPKRCRRAGGVAEQGLRLASAVECEMICQGSCTLDMRRLGIDGWESVIDDLREKERVREQLRWWPSAVHSSEGRCGKASGQDSEMHKVLVSSHLFTLDYYNSRKTLNY